MKLSILMKKVLAVGLIGVMMAGLVACGGSNESGETSTDTTAATETAGSDVTLKFQQWWGAELPEGYLEDICGKYEQAAGV